MTLDLLITRFGSYLLTEKRVSQNTCAAYQQDIAQLHRFLKAHNIQDIAVVTPEILTLFLRSLHKKKLSARSIARKIATIKAFFLYISTRWDVKNSAAELKTPKLEKTLPRVLSEKDIESLFQIAGQDTSNNGVRNMVMLYTLYVTGMRVSELIHLTIDAVQFETNMIMIDGKGGKQRVVPIPDGMTALLRRYLENIRPLLIKEQSTRFVFPVVYGGKLKALTRQAFWVIIKQLWRKAEISQPISPHTLRHSFATHMLKKGANLRSLQLLLGHEHLATVQMYTHVETGYLRKIYDKKHPRS